MFAWLDDGGWASAWANAWRTTGASKSGSKVSGARTRSPCSMRPGSCCRASTARPWRSMTSSCSLSRVGSATPEKPIEPRHADLQLMFMAAAPEGQHELDFEAEEAAILDATQRLPMRLVVEETGALDFLGGRLGLGRRPVRGAPSVLSRRHRSGSEARSFCLETAEGGEDRVGPGAYRRGARGRSAAAGGSVGLPHGGVRRRAGCAWRRRPARWFWRRRLARAGSAAGRAERAADGA